MDIHPPHTVKDLEKLTFTCLNVGKHVQGVVSTNGKFMVCGHCMHVLTDVQGNKIPYTILDCLKNWREWHEDSK